MSNAPRARLTELAELTGGELIGGDLEVATVRSLENAGPGDLAFVRAARYVAAGRESRAGAFVVPADLRDKSFGKTTEGHERPRLVVDNADVAIIRILERLHPPTVLPPGTHPTAVVDETAGVDPSAHIGPYAVVGANAVIGARSVVHAHCVVGDNARLGEDVVLHPHVVLYADTELGDRVIVHSGTVIGADGFGYATQGGVHLKVPQVGRAVLGEDVEVGALSAVDRAALDETRIGKGTKIDNLVQVGHNVILGQGCILCGKAGISGSTQAGNYVVFGGASGAIGHLNISDGVQVAGLSMAVKSYEPGQQVSGIPAVPIKEAHRRTALLGRLGEAFRRLRRLEKAVFKEEPEEDKK